MIKIKDLQAGIEEKEILRGIDLEINAGEVHAIMGPNGSGKSTLSSIIAGREDYEISGGTIDFEGEDLMDLSPEERAHKGVFLSFQYPVEIPGVTVSNFIKTAINESRKGRGEEAMEAREMLAMMREKTALLEMDKSYLSRSLNEGFLVEKKSAMRFFKWQCFNQNWPFLMRLILV